MARPALKTIDAVPETSIPVDPLVEAEKLYKLQMQRVEIEFKNEKNIQKLLEGTNREINTASNLLGQIAKLRGDDHVPEIVLALPESSRARVLAIAQTLLGVDVERGNELPATVEPVKKP